MVAPYMTRIKLPATWTYMYEKLVNISAWYMVQCNNYQSVHLWYVRTGMFVFSAILFCVLRYCCAVVPSSNKIPGCKCQVMADSPKRNSLVWPGRIRFWLFRYFSLSDKATEIQSKQKESNVSEKKRLVMVISVITLANNKTKTEVEYCKPQQNTRIQKL